LFEATSYEVKASSIEEESHHVSTYSFAVDFRCLYLCKSLGSVYRYMLR